MSRIRWSDLVHCVELQEPLVVGDGNLPHRASCRLVALLVANSWGLTRDSSLDFERSFDKLKLNATLKFLMISKFNSSTISPCKRHFFESLGI
jgi:hypothetical protein